jgi:PHB/PHA accumulation regulator DNA-binding domain
VSIPPSRQHEQAPSARPGPQVRLITRYANRKLYDTQARELTSLRRIEGLVRGGTDIRVVDHDTGADMTAEVLVGILSSSISQHDAEEGVAALISLIRSPRELLEALAHDRARATALRSMTKRVRLLSATLDALVASMPAAQTAQADPEAPASPGRAGQ